jgi:hypothetical protein
MLNSVENPLKRYAKDLRPARKAAFVSALKAHGVITIAADAVGIPRATINNWRTKDPEFAEACEDAYQQAVDVAEMELRRRGVEGWEEPILYRGEPIWQRDPVTGELVLDNDFNPMPFTIPRKSDRLLEVYTRSHRPIYKEKTEVALTGAGGGPVQNEIIVQYVMPDGKSVGDYERKAIDNEAIDNKIIDNEVAAKLIAFDPLED